MTATILPTPADLSITPRDRRFGRDETPRDFGTADASKRPQSIMRCRRPSRPAKPFSSRACASSATARRAKLAEEIKAFTTQEAIHSREHDAFNKRALDAGYDLSRLEAQVDRRLAVTALEPPIVSLAATMALEHFTAILAHRASCQSDAISPAPTRKRRTCGAGTRSRRSSTRASPTTPGFTRRATGRGSSAGRSRPR